MIDTSRLDEIVHLDSGTHDPDDGEMCLLEAVAYVAGLGFSDRPACTSPVLGDFGRDLNDRLSDKMRQQLIPLIPRLIGTAGDGQDATRGYLALDWLIRVYTPAWLELAGLTDSAAELRALGRIVDFASAERAAPVVRASGTKAAAAADAVVWAAAWAARDAAWAARDAAWAAGDAARAAARAARPARDAARAARAAAADAAGAVEAVAWAAGDAARVATTPTVERLQRSAIHLFTRMINPAPERTYTINKRPALQAIKRQLFKLLKGRLRNEF